MMLIRIACVAALASCVLALPAPVTESLYTQQAELFEEMLGEEHNTELLQLSSLADQVKAHDLDDPLHPLTAGQKVHEDHKFTEQLMQAVHKAAKKRASQFQKNTNTLEGWVNAAHDKIKDDDAPDQGPLKSLFKTILNTEAQDRKTKQGKAAMRKPTYAEGLFRKWQAKEEESPKHGIPGDLIRHITSAVEDKPGGLFTTIKAHGRKRMIPNGKALGFQDTNIFKSPTGEDDPSETEVQHAMSKLHRPGVPTFASTMARERDMQLPADAAEDISHWTGN